MTKREIVFWGAGQIGKLWLEGGFDNDVSLIIDNNPESGRKTISNKKIISPKQIDDWGKYFVIITSNYYEDISEQMKGYNLQYGIDFISYIDYMSMPIPVGDVTSLIEEIVFGNNVSDKDFAISVTNKIEYVNIRKEKMRALEYENALNQLCQRKIGKRLSIPGYCDVCNKEVNFEIDYIWSDGTMPAWRETVYCPNCHCNSRMRFLIDWVLRQNDRESDIYICEQTTNTYKELKKRLPKLIGSEYLGDQYKSGEIIDGINHQDVLNLSFSDNNLDCIVAADVYEHVSDYNKVFTEAYRCLKEKGKLIFSIPIFKDKEKTIQRTAVEYGKLTYLLPKIFHGNPISEEGSLVFFDYGWDVLDSLRKVGFSEAYAIVYFSVEKGYLGDLPVIFEAIR